ncbi:MAG: oligosaccharide flippase family protein [Chlamydiia bacterium]|nr:oligosaccharide flippase family protein [Chlamydiia bacterium]
MSMIKKTISNTVSNYVHTLLQLITGIYLTRIIFFGLGEVGYGFWTLAWAIFGYSILVDFGFGYSVQKMTAEYSVNDEEDEYNGHISTIFFFYLLVGPCISLIAFALSFFLDTIFTFPEGTDIAYYQSTFRWFGLLVGLTLPFGAAPEILAGLNRLTLRNCVRITFLFINLAGTYLLFHWGYGLFTLAIFAAGVPLLSNIVTGLIAFRLLPKAKLRWNYVSLKHLSAISQFGLFAYISTFTNLIIMKSDQIMLGSGISIPAIAIYQVGSRVAELLHRFCTQFQENITPIIASLREQGDRKSISLVLLHSNRFIVFFSTGVYILTMLFSSEILYCWLKVTDPIYTQVSYLLLTARYVTIIFHSATHRALLLCGRHRLAGLCAAIEAVLNIVLSILLVRVLGVLGVCWGTLISTTLINVFLVFPFGCRQADIPVTTMLRASFLPAVLAGIPTAAIVLVFKNAMAAESSAFGLLTMGTLLLSGIYLALSYLIFLDSAERNKVSGRLRSLRT